MGCGSSIDATFPESINSGAQEIARREIEDEVTLGEVLGSGAFAVCRAAVRKDDGSLVCVKQVLKQNGKKFDRSAVLREIKIMAMASGHPGCVAYQTAAEDDFAIHVVQEAVLGGNLRDRLSLRGSLCEAESAIILKQLLEAVKYLHEHRICHRDIKPENILMKSKDPGDPGYNQVKLTDFGLSADGACYDLYSLESIRGTPNYLAPEIVALAFGVEGRYNCKVDIFSLGVLLFLMLTGKQPFHTELPGSRQHGCKPPRRPLPDLSSSVWKNLTEGAHVTCAALTRHDPAERPSARSCLAMSWLRCAPLMKCQCRLVPKIGDNMLPNRLASPSSTPKSSPALHSCNGPCSMEGNNPSTPENNNDLKFRVHDLRVSDISGDETNWLDVGWCNSPNSPVARSSSRVDSPHGVRMIRDDESPHGFKIKLPGSGGSQDMRDSPRSDHSNHSKSGQRFTSSQFTPSQVSLRIAFQS